MGPLDVAPHPECLRTALTAGDVADVDHARHVRRILGNLDDGICPRCGGALRDEFGRSRMTRDRCIPVCGECAGHEALVTTLPPDSLADWPSDASEVRAQYQVVIRRAKGPATG